MNRKALIRLTESDLHRIIKESVNRILKEGYYDFDDDFNADDVECPYCGSNYSDGYVGGVNLNNSQKIKQDNNDFLTVVNEFKKSKPSTF